MSKRLLLAAGLVVLLAGPPAPAAQPAQEVDEWTPPALTEESGDLPEAREVVQKMADFVRATPELTVEARVTYESVQESGQKLQFDMLQWIAMRRPDQLVWATLRDDATVDRAWYDQGKFSMIRQPANVWAQVRLPSGIAAMAHELVSSYKIDVPFPDILSGSSQGLWMDEATAITYVGEAWVGGQWTDHVAVRRPGVDVQLWVQQGEPFPAKMAVVFTEEEGMPSYTARFSKWSTTLPDDPTLFVFTPPPGAERIDAVPVVER